MPERVCVLYPAAPMITARRIREGHELLDAKTAPCVIPVTEYPAPVWRALKVNAAGALEPIWPEHSLTRSQDLPKAYHDAAQFYWVRPKPFLEARSLRMPGTMPLVLPRDEVVDIDTEEDWQLAERVFRQIDRRGMT